MKTKMYMLTETSEFMMSFVIVTKKDNVIVVDGGRKEDIPLLRKYVGGRRIAAWILTHPHSDHISGFISEMQRNRLGDFEIERVCYNFPDYAALINKTDVPDRTYFLSELNECLLDFMENEELIGEKRHIVRQGEIIEIDEVKIEFLYTGHDGLYANLMNDYSLVFKVTGEGKSVLFLGDLGPDGGDVLFRESRDKLKSDMVQMAHHGHMNVSMEVYEKIAPEACLWCAPLWLYNEPEIPDYLSDGDKLCKMGRIRMYGTGLTRRWMDALGVKHHYVSGNGTQEFDI